MELHYARLLFTFTLKNDLADRHGFFASRSEFEECFRWALSCRRGDCTGCRSIRDCAYAQTFGQEIAKDPEAVKRHQKPPLPFVFQFPVLDPAPNRGRKFELALNLFGSAVQHVPCYVSAVTHLVEAKGGIVVAVEAESPGGGRTAVGGETSPVLPLLGSLDPAAAGPLATDSVTIHLLTPLKILHDGRLLKTFTFANFARTLMRRVSSLAYHYEGAEPVLDYRWLSQCSESVGTADPQLRLSTWAGRPAGILGRVRFVGDIQPFHLLLQIGTATHLGKGASFGYGSYRIES